jgi:hypothetical protein
MVKTENCFTSTDPCTHTNQGYDHMWLYWVLRKWGLCRDLSHLVLGTYKDQIFAFTQHFNVAFICDTGGDNTEYLRRGLNNRLRYASIHSPTQT